MNQNNSLKSDEDRLQDERNFHDEIFSSKKRKSVGKFYSINKTIEKDYDAEIFQNPKGKVILEYGCGMGDKLMSLDKLGAMTHGIDISQFAIRDLSTKAKVVGSKTVYEVMNAENLTFEDRTFDLIYGSGILHHLNLEKAFLTIGRKLKNGGRAIFIEPLGHNPLINGFRNKTPDIRTEDEHPLLVGDFVAAKKYFDKISVRYYYLSTLGLPLIFGERTPNFLITIFNFLDKIIFTIVPPLRKHAWQVLLKFEKPK